MNYNSSASNTPTLLARKLRVYAFLKAHNTGVLATANAEKIPHASVIYYSMDEDNIVSFLSKTTTTKAQDLAENPKTVLLVFDAETQTEVQVEGVAHDGYNVAKIASAVNPPGNLNDKNTPTPLEQIKSGEYVAYRIEPDRIKYSSYASPASRRQKPVFDVLEANDLYYDGE